MIGTLEQLYKDMESIVFDYTKDGKCVGCWECCSNLLTLLDQEVQDIKRYIKQHQIAKLNDDAKSRVEYEIRHAF